MATLLTIHESSSNAQARGRRLKTVRMMAGLTRKLFEERHGISVNTLQSWEVGKGGGLTERGVKRLLPILLQERIVCTEQWLLYDIGNPPQIIDISFIDRLENTAQLLGGTAFIQELRYFRQLHPNWVDFIISDDGMAPHYMKDDVVAGRRHSGKDILTTVGKSCIVQTTQNDILFRCVMKSLQPDCYNLVCTNIHTSLYTPVLYNQQLVSAAPALWHRRCDKVGW